MWNFSWKSSCNVDLALATRMSSRFRRRKGSFWAVGGDTFERYGEIILFLILYKSMSLYFWLQGSRVSHPISCMTLL